MDSVPTITALHEVLEFLTSTPSPQQIIEFQSSDALQMRVRYLLDQNQNGYLTAEENAELEEISRVNHFMRMLKIKAREKLAEE